jgi:hypothetical protein
MTAAVKPPPSIGIPSTLPTEPVGPLYPVIEPDAAAADASVWEANVSKLVGYNAQCVEPRKAIEERDLRPAKREELLQEYDAKVAADRIAAFGVIRADFDRLDAQLRDLGDPSVVRARLALKEPAPLSNLLDVLTRIPVQDFKLYARDYAAQNRQAMLAVVGWAATLRTDLHPEDRRWLNGLLAAAEPATCGPARQLRAKLAGLRARAEVVLLGGPDAVPADVKLSIAHRFTGSHIQR